MIPPRIAPLAALILALAAGPAFSKGPGTSEPASGALSEVDAQEIFDELLAASHHDDPHWLTKENRRPTQMKFVHTHRDIAGSPAIALQARMGHNNNPFDLVVVTYGLLELVRERGQLAFIIAHELSHLVSKDGENMVEFKMALFDRWNALNEARVDAMSDGEIVAAFTSDTEALANACQEYRETMADGDAINFMGSIKEPDGTVKYPRAQGADAISSAQDWVWARGKDDVPDQTHQPLAERVKYLKKWASRMDGTESKLAKMSGALVGGTGSDVDGPGAEAPAEEKPLAGNDYGVTPDAPCTVPKKRDG